MGEEDRRAGFIHHGGHRIRDHIDIKRPSIRGHLAEILIQGLLVVSELHAFKILRPHAHAELIKPHLLIRFWRHRPFCGGTPGVAPTRLIDKIS
ncbi:hypothetical protein D3C80_1861470 [compost metagenome]